MNTHDRVKKIIAEALIGKLPIQKGPFISNAEARRVAHYDNEKRYGFAETITTFVLDALFPQVEGDVYVEVDASKESPNEEGSYIAWMDDESLEYEPYRPDTGWWTETVGPQHMKVKTWLKKLPLLLPSDEREQMLLQFGEFMWHCSEANEDDERDLAIGYDENGLPNSVSLEIFGRTHSEFKFIPEPPTKTE